MNVRRVFEIWPARGYDRLDPLSFVLPNEVLPDRRIAASWQPMALKLKAGVYGQGDVQSFLTGAGIILNKTARSTLADVLRPDEVELLPLPFENEMFWLVNVINVIDCLDTERSVFSGGSLVPDYLAFHPHLVKCTLFKLPQQTLGIYVPEYTGDPKTEFKAAVEHAGLKGIKFDLLWESEEAANQA